MKNLRRINIALAFVALAFSVLTAAQGVSSYVPTPVRPESPTFPTTEFFRQMFMHRNDYKLALPGTLRDNIQNGKLTLTLADVTRMAVARNSDIWLARLDVQSAETPLWRAYSPFDPRFTGSFNSSF